ncbi:hypothetical protein QEN19_000777 [Hanseniaspora menglaensis]
MSNTRNSNSNYDDFLNTYSEENSFSNQRHNLPPQIYHDEEIFHDDSEIEFEDNPNGEFDNHNYLKNLNESHLDPFQSTNNINYIPEITKNKRNSKDIINFNTIENEKKQIEKMDYNNQRMASNARLISSSYPYDNNDFSHYNTETNQADYGQKHTPESPFQDLEMGKYHTDYDNESIMLDTKGDEYPINSYLRRNGTMFNPYRDNKVYHDVWIRNEGVMIKENPFQHQIQPPNTCEPEPINNEYFHTNDEFFDDDKMNEIFPETAEEENMNEEKPFDVDSSEDKDYTDMGELNSSETNIKRSLTTRRRFFLENGNFVFDCPLSSTLIYNYYKSVDNPMNVSNEFKFMRYQAVTCQPHEFAFKRFALRQQKFSIPRATELMIVITMYNEDDFLLGRTLKGIFDNIRHMTKKTNSKTWGPDAWKKIVVSIVSDGRSKIHPRSLALMSSLGCYQDGFAKSEINGSDVIAHLYEHTTKVNIEKVNEDGTLKLKCDQTSIPVQFLFCLKEQNQQKINSHRWAIEAFADVLNPNVICLLDAGTMPGKDSIYNLWKEFKNPQVGGACGEIKVDIGNYGKNLLNPLVAAQNFEYKMSNILDKTTESCFGYISVLPGAFSAYRYQALLGAPLEKYFHGESSDIKLFESNMYLAEDRILCFEIITKTDYNWILTYCKDSFASTDVPDKIPEFILQRRRWMNGSFFAALYSFVHFGKIWRSGQSIPRKFVLTIEILYMGFQTLVSWFSLSSFFLVFRILTLSLSVTFAHVSAFNYLAVCFLWIYGFTLLATFILSLGNRPKGTQTFYLLVFVFFALLMTYTIFAAIYLTVHTVKNLIANEATVTFGSLMRKTQFRDILVSMLSTYILYIITSVMYLQPFHMFTSFLQYLLISPSYINVLNIYAFCNLHDVTWGTKGAVKANFLGKVMATTDGTVQTEIPIHAKEIDENYRLHAATLAIKPDDEEASGPSVDERKQSYYATARSIILILWLTTNFALAAIILELGGYAQYAALKKSHANSYTQTFEVISERARVYFAIILWVVAGLAAVRAIGCTFYLTDRFFSRFRSKSG